MKQLETWLGIAAAFLFLVVGGIMNFTYAGTLGTTEYEILLWRALSIGATLNTAVGLRLIRNALQDRDRIRAAAATVILALSLSYDVLAAYGFSARQHAETTFEADQSAETYRRAAAAVEAAQSDLAPYADALDLQVAQHAEKILADDIAAIDRVPGVLDKEGPCARPQRQAALELCPKRASLVRELGAAATQRVRSEAKARKQADLDAATAKLQQTPAPKPHDPRAELVGNRITEWLPVALLTIGALLGFFTIGGASRQSPATAGTQPDHQPHTRGATPLPIEPAAPAQPAPGGRALPAARQSATPRGKPGADRLALALSGISASATLPAGLHLDSQGFIRGTQRALARATGYRTTTGFHRVLHEAAEADLIDLDTSGTTTAVRPRISATH